MGHASMKRMQGHLCSKLSTQTLDFFFSSGKLLIKVEHTDPDIFSVGVAECEQIARALGFQVASFFPPEKRKKRKVFLVLRSSCPPSLLPPLPPTPPTPPCVRLCASLCLCTSVCRCLCDIVLFSFCPEKRAVSSLFPSKVTSTTIGLKSTT